MQERDADVDRQRRQFAGRYVAWLDGRVILNAETYDELIDRLEQMPIDQDRLVVEFIRRTDVVYI